MNRDELVSYLDELLDVKSIQDRSNNGLQVAGTKEVEHLAFAVDAGLDAFHRAARAGAQMLIVHHGLFWSEPVMVIGIHRARLAALLDAAISLYAVHLPLDFHDTLGNNATLARWLDLESAGTFGHHKGSAAGFIGDLPVEMTLEEFAARVAAATGEPVTGIWPFGRERVRRVAIVSGGAAFLVDQVAEAGADVYLTGEVSHGNYHQASELGINVVFGGHYATETAGLKALAGHLAEQFKLETTFLDLPTGA
ncbi:MAG TPA: Nif3-like dinuclear metal center hexameric protein [Anaerolineae bacterium]|nr:Nif3-like dinuclear metal center hexameric protein [Anaerolineae bacterium]